MNKVYVLLIVLCSINLIYGQDFTEIVSGLPGVNSSSTAWGDYDNDGDLDLLHTGYTGSDRISKIYRNDSSTFTDINAGLFGVSDSSVDWGDYDNDGDLDILLTGYSSISPYYISKIYRNDSGSFTDIKAKITGVYDGSVAWGDYDNDGDLDFLLAGYTNSPVRISKIYRNDSGVFTDINAGLAGVENSSVAWGDYDNDGDIDILLTGDAGGGYVSKIYRNNSGVFTDINAGLTGVYYSSAAWGDYDNDNDLDILLTGNTGTVYISKIYRNDSGIFTDINAGLTGVHFGSVAWGDYDNDGDLDILLTGYSTSIGRISKLYRNDSGIFTDKSTSLIGVYSGSAAWGDYDNDNDLDILLSGSSGAGYVSKIYRNNSQTFNTKPNAPSNLSSQMGTLSTVLSWDKATDNETPQNGLSYSLCIGTLSQNCAIKSPMSNILTGYRKVVSLGNINQKNSYTINNLPEGQYYWSVQAVDHAFAGSEFSAEQSFILNIDSPPVTVATEATNADLYSFTANWETTSDTKGYYLDVATDSSYTNYVSGYQNRDVANVTSFNVTGLSSFTNYNYRVRAYNNGGTGVNSNTITVKTLYTQFLPIATSLTVVSYGCSIAWGDYDNDGDLDILLTGYTGSSYISKIYRNDSGVFTDINAGLTGVDDSSVAWGDYDNDGDLDILLTGFASFLPNYISKIYRNDSGVFTDINAGLTGVDNSSVAWGDYDNDGDLDILLTGYTGSVRFSKIYRNDAGVFTDANAGLIGVSSGSVAWGDYDNDGDLDILLTGYTGSVRFSEIYRNDAGVFTDAKAGLIGVSSGSIAWGDYDNDGDLDILLTGMNGSGQRISKVYRNDSGVFTDISSSLAGVYGSSVAWGDYDNDGDLDILLTGDAGTSNISKIYRNDSGIFTDINAGLTGVYYSSVAWGDYDNDGDLDILLTGFTGSVRISKIYRNDNGTFNTRSNPPSNLTTSYNDSTITFSWDKATDNETPQDGLSYNFYLGTQRLAGNLNSAMSDTETGFRKVVQLGNAQQNTSYTLNKALPIGLYYWSVQAVDHAFAGSDFASEKSFVILSSPQNVHIKHKDDLLKLTWDEVPGAQMYYVYASDDPESEFVNVSKQGTFNGVSWTQTISSVKKFYYIVAVIK